MTIASNFSNPAWQHAMATRMASQFGPTRAPTPGGSVGPAAAPGRQSITPTAPHQMPKPTSVTDDIQQAKQTYDTGKQMWDLGKQGVDKIGALVNPTSSAPTAQAAIDQAVTSVLPGSAPTAAVPQVGQGMGALVNPTTAAAPAGASGVGGAMSAAGPWAALAAVGDKAFYGNGALGEKNLQDKKMLGKMDAGDFARVANPSSYLKDPGGVAKSALDIFSLGLF